MEPLPDGGLRVTNIGRATLRIDGDEVDEGAARQGTILEIAGQVILGFTHRPSVLPHAEAPLHRFGEADADGVVGESPDAWALRAQVAFAAERDVHLLVLGASGTGKELVANAIHSRSRRGDRPLVARNAATLPEGLLDAELFGDARGYPNPGMLERAGVIGEAHESTLFLDEFSSLPHSLQAHLLRVLDAREYSRLGEGQARRSDFRLLAASNRPDSELKHDLRARLPLTVSLPDLNERAEDVPLIARHLVLRIGARDPAAVARFVRGNHVRLSPELVSYLVRRRWSTHVRELERLLWRSIQESPGDTLDMPPPTRQARPEAPTRPSRSGASVVDEESSDADTVDPASFTAEALQEALDANEGRQEPTWRALGLASRHVLTRLVKRYGLRVKGQ